MTTSDFWQLGIGILAIANAAWLVYKLRKTGDEGIIAAIIPRAYLGVLYLIDAFLARDTMEPMRSLAYLAVIVLFFSANATHLVGYLHNRGKPK